MKPTLIFIGAGACPDSWNCVVDAIREVEEPTFSKNISRRNANHYFAKEVSITRWFKATIVELKNEKETKKEELAGLERQFESHIQKLERLRAKISKHISDSNLQLNKDLTDLLDRKTKTQNQSKYFIVTTNWDTLIEDFGVPSNSIAHLHGIADPKKLHPDLFKIEKYIPLRSKRDLIYLPTETSFEEYLGNDIKLYYHFVINILNRVSKITEEIIIYGLGFSALDAELLMQWQLIFEKNQNKKIKDVKIINPRFKCVRDNLKHLTPHLNFVESDAYNA